MVTTKLSALQSFPLSGPGFFGCLGPGGEGGGRKMPAAHNSKTMHGIEIQFGRVVENHKRCNFYEILPIKYRKSLKTFLTLKKR